MTTAGQLSIISVARRVDVPVCDVYRAVIDGDLPARFPGAAGGVLTVLRDDADRWAKTLRQVQPADNALASGNQPDSPQE
ncbi:MAG: hypothetical protein ABJA93_07915 [Sporichthyaceae bacterium]